MSNTTTSGPVQSLVVKLRSFIAQLSYLPRTLKLIQEASPRWTKAWAILLLIQGLLPVASVYLIRLLVDSLVAAANSNGSWGRPVIFGALMAGTQLLAELLLGLNEWVRTAQSELIQDHIKDLVHAKSVSLDLAFFDSPDYYDRLHRATDEGSNRPLALLESTGSLLQNGMTVVGMAAVLIPYGLWLPILLVIGTLPALYVVIRFNRRYHGWWQQTTPDRRWSSYYDVMLTHNQAASELRMFGLGGPFRAAYNSLRSRLRGERLDLTRDQAFARLAASIIALLTMAVAMLLLGLRALRGALTLGDLALLYQAFNSGQDLMRSLLSNLGQIYSNTFYLGNLFEFLALSPTVTDPPRPVHTSTFLSEGIRFRHVAFGYSSDRPPAIRDFDLTIPKGMVVAIVGPNGAGKSTLVKLLCRFYDPDSGCIELDNVDLRAMPLEQVRRTITVLFQQPVPYHATAGQNIAIADLASRPSTDRIEAAARNSGAHEIIGRLPKGYDTLLGKWFADGAELSAGEWQRLALARAYVRAAEIVVLDEPTSFMDSWAETDWFDRLRALVKGRTAIVITHRFTIAMRADIIHVMNEGRIIESGSHNDLLARGGFYAESWTAQMQAARALAVPVSVDDLSFAAAETSASTEMH